MLGFVFKILLVSVGISFFIKYGTEGFGISPTDLNALILITLPCLIMSLILLWRFRKNINANP